MKNLAALKSKKLPFWLTTTIVAGTFGVLFAIEMRCPLRRSKENKLRRNARNFAVAGTAAIALSLTEIPVVEN